MILQKAAGDGRPGDANPVATATRLLADDLRTMPERVSNIAASDLQLLSRAADILETK